MPSFDVVSKLEWAEVKNALNQAHHELSQRFDFKGTGAQIEQTDAGFTITANSDERITAAYDVLREKLIRRKVSLKHFEDSDPVAGPKSSRKMLVTVKEGIDKDQARRILQYIKDAKFKVVAAVQQDTLRITGKKRDDLQLVIADLKSQDFDLSLQFINFRE